MAKTIWIRSALAANSASKAWCFWCLDWMLAGSYTKVKGHLGGLLRGQGSESKIFGDKEKKEKFMLLMLRMESGF